MKFRAWFFYLIAIGLNSVFGYVTGDRFGLGYNMMAMIVYGGIVLGFYYLIRYLRAKKTNNFISK